MRGAALHRRTAEFVVETLSLQPKVLRVKNFLSATETAAIRQLSAKNEMKEMLKQGPPGCEDLDTGCDVFRNESITWLSPTFGHWTVLPPFAPEPLIAGINRRAAELTRIDKAQMEGMLITQSKRSQHYWAHGDFHTAMHTEDPYDTGFYEDETINKFATLTTFLNDPTTDDGSGFTSGGEMQFPLAGSYAPDAEKGCPPNVGISCGNAYTLETFSQARSSSERAKGWVDCDKGLRIAPEAGTLVIHYNQPAQRHQDGYIDQKAFNAQCAVETTNDDDTGAWRLTMAYTSRMPERPMQQQQGTFLPSKAHPGAGGDGEQRRHFCCNDHSRHSIIPTVEHSRHGTQYHGVLVRVLVRVWLRRPHSGSNRRRCRWRHEGGDQGRRVIRRLVLMPDCQWPQLLQAFKRSKGRSFVCMSTGNIISIGERSAPCLLL